MLEIGTGSGYQAAVLAECVTPGGTVDSIEIVPELGRQAEALLRELGYRNVHVRIGDGYVGWPEHAPFDAIVLTAARSGCPNRSWTSSRSVAAWWRPSDAMSNNCS